MKRYKISCKEFKYNLHENFYIIWWKDHWWKPWRCLKWYNFNQKEQAYQDYEALKKKLKENER